MRVYTIQGCFRKIETGKAVKKTIKTRKEARKKASPYTEVMKMIKN